MAVLPGEMIVKGIEVEDVGDWELVCFFNYYRYTVVSMDQRQRNFIMERELQDGHGEPGFVPAQGWDWSGIRDSSDEAQAKMAAWIRRYLRQHGIGRLVVEERVP